MTLHVPGFEFETSCAADGTAVTLVVTYTLSPLRPGYTIRMDPGSASVLEGLIRSARVTAKSRRKAIKQAGRKDNNEQEKE